MKNNLFPLIFLFCFFKIQMTHGQNYYVPYNFAPINIVEKGDFTFSASESIFSKYRNQNYSISQSPRSNFFWAVGGVFTLHKFPLDTGRPTLSFPFVNRITLEKERTTIVDFSVGSYYFYQTKKDRKGRKKRSRRKKRKRGKYVAMEKGILISGGLGYSFGKIRLDFLEGKSSFYFQKINLNLGVQLQLKRFGIGYYGSVGVLDFKKVNSKGRIDMSTFRSISALKKKNSFTLLNTMFRCFYGNQFGKLYIERIGFPKNIRFGGDSIYSRYSLGLSLRIHEFFNLKK